MAPVVDSRSLGFRLRFEWNLGFHPEAVYLATEFLVGRGNPSPGFFTNREVRAFIVQQGLREGAVVGSADFAVYPKARRAFLLTYQIRDPVLRSFFPSRVRAGLDLRILGQIKARRPQVDTLVIGKRQSRVAKHRFEDYVSWGLHPIEIEKGVSMAKVKRHLARAMVAQDSLPAPFAPAVRGYPKGFPAVPLARSVRGLRRR